MKNLVSWLFSWFITPVISLFAFIPFFKYLFGIELMFSTAGAAAVPATLCPLYLFSISNLIALFIGFMVIAAFLIIGNYIFQYLHLLLRVFLTKQ